jgi:hypothetical protein
MGRARREEARIEPKEDGKKEIGESVSRVWLVPLVALLAAVMTGDQITVPHGFYNGQQYLTAFSGPKDPSYAAGFIDGMLSSTTLGAPIERVQKLKDCIHGMNNGQVEAILDKFITEHPERWDESMTVLGYVAMAAACQSRGFDLAAAPAK